MQKCKTLQFLLHPLGDGSLNLTSTFCIIKGVATLSDKRVLTPHSTAACPLKLYSHTPPSLPALAV